MISLLFNLTAKPKKAKTNRFSSATQKKQFAKYKRKVLPKKPLRKSAPSKSSNIDDDDGSNKDMPRNTPIARDTDSQTQNRRSTRLGTSKLLHFNYPFIMPHPHMEYLYL